MYIDDFCYVATQSKDGLHIPTIQRATIHGIEAVFPPPAVTKHQGGKDPISWKKLLQGNGHFELKKDMIRFIFNGVKRTVHLPPAKALAYLKEIHRILRRKSVPLKTLQGVVGKVRHASIILPAAHGFFMPVNAAMRGSPKCRPWHQLGSASCIGGYVYPPPPPIVTANTRQGTGTGHAPLRGLS